MPSRSLDDLHALMKPLAYAFEDACKAATFDVLIYCTFRSRDEQETLWEQGRLTPGKVVTNAKPGQSAHNWGLAFDGVPLLLGKPIWNLPLSHELWQHYGQLAKAVGLEWGGTWATFKEGPHCQHPDWKTIAGIA